jgi:ribosomal protein S18 acetylase RimI-like enzyme
MAVPADIDIRPLARDADLEASGFAFTGYESDEMYAAAKAETDARTAITLALVPRPGFVKRWDDGPSDRQRRREVLAEGLSYGAYFDGRLVGVVLMERRQWNDTLHVEDIEVMPPHRGRGIGRSLLDKAVASARALGARLVSLETQNTNVPAIRFYRANGFEIDSVDLSLYTNDDAAHGEVAIIMKRKLAGRSA